MRELKFRAWIKPLQVLSNVQELFRDGGAVVDDYEYALESDAIKVMQFTGLKDVNGTDIYEGDIVAMPYIDPMGGISYVNDFLSDVIFERGCFQVWCNELKPERHNIENWIERTVGEYKSNYGNVSNWGDCVLTVIGNIYENPELLK